jgi:hypothetical protein
VFLALEDKRMAHGLRSWKSLALAGTLVTSLAGLACSDHHYYRVYDPYYTDYHVWSSDETVYYRRWADETHRDRDRDFRRLSKNEQKEYWTWRHNHGDHDRDDHRDRH